MVDDTKKNEKIKKENEEQKYAMNDLESASNAYDDYEILPHKEIVELRDELKRLKDTPTELGKHFQVSIDELDKKMDKLIKIFEKAEEEMSFEEGGRAFKERLKPYNDKMEKILDQNSEIAEGIVALADLMNEVNDRLGGRRHVDIKTHIKPEERGMPPPVSGLRSPGMPPPVSGLQSPGMPPRGMQFGSSQPFGMPPPKPPKKSLF